MKGPQLYRIEKLKNKKNTPHLKRVGSLLVNHGFPGGLSDQILYHIWSSFGPEEKKKLAKAGLYWKPNGHGDRI